MAMNGFTKDMNIIQKLNDEPNDRDGLTAGELKAKFDEGGLAVKDYLNNTVKPHVDGMEEAADAHAADAVKHITAEERANWNNKVDKVSGKGLSTNDYTTAEKNKLAGIEAQANKYTHPAYTARTGKPTANLTPDFGGTVTVSQITSDAKGHVTGATDRTIKIPATAASTTAAGLMSAADKAKLNGIAAGAQVNQNAFSNVKVGSATVAADAKTDTLELTAGDNITLTADAANDRVTIAAKDTTYSSKAAASGGTAVSLVTTGEKYNWNSKANGSHTHSAGDITSGTFAPARLPAATASAQGAVKLGAAGGAAAYSHTHTADTVTDLVTATKYGPTGLVSFQDAHGGLPLKTCLVSIMPAQSGSGNPTPANVRPISGREHVKVWRFGKNFFPQADVVVASGTGNETIYFPQPLPAGTYVFSADLTSTYNGNCIAHIIRADNTTITVTGTPGTRAALSFTSPSGNEIIGIRFYVGSNWATSYSNSGAWSNIQVETGSTATAYEASETVVDADLPKPVYGGTLDVLTGKLTVTHGYISPSEYTGSSLSDTTVVVFTHIPLGKHGTSYNIVSNVATGAARTDANIARYGYAVSQSIVGESPLLFISASTTAHPTTASLSQALLAAGACFAYELETPEVYQLTPSQVASLAGQNHVWADTGNITVEYGAFLAAEAEARKIASDILDANKADKDHTHNMSRLTGVLAIEKGGTSSTDGRIHVGQKDWGTIGAYSTSEGYETNASGQCSHAEGEGTTASGNGGSHAEGFYTEAKGTNGSHAEGAYTIAAGQAQHVFGRYNISDTTSVEIVGWGTDTTRKNIRTLDKSGNMTIAGTLTQSSDARLKDVVGEVPDVSGIRAVRFKWNDKKGTHDDRDHIGYIAQEVEKIAPYLVGDDSNGYKSLDYIALLCAKVEMLERRVAELEGGD